MNGEIDFSALVERFVVTIWCWWCVCISASKHLLKWRKGFSQSWKKWFAMKNLSKRYCAIIEALLGFDQVIRDSEYIYDSIIGERNMQLINFRFQSRYSECSKHITFKMLGALHWTLLIFQTTVIVSVFFKAIYYYVFLFIKTTTKNQYFKLR